jgi:catechol 2,3-dioxygenase-like lactoylglutathione lyase family enzyme
MLENAALVAFVPVTDLTRARAFYEGTLGLRVQSADDYGCVLVSNGTIVRLAQVGEYERPAHTVLGWEVPFITETVAALTAAGVVLHRYEGMGQDELGVWAAPSGYRVAWFPDSEGNTLSLTEVSR